MESERFSWKQNVAAHSNEVASQWGRLSLTTEVKLPALLAVQPGELILDAGCGTGQSSFGLVAAGCRVRGLELAPHMVEAARLKARELALDLETASFQKGNLEQLPFAANTFDGIVCINALDFVPAPGAALLELSRVLKPAHRLVVQTLGAYSPVKWNYWQRFLPGRASLPNFINAILPWELEHLLKELGWQIVEQYGLFVPDGDGRVNSYTAELASQLKDPILKQTIASAWGFVTISPKETSL